MATNDEINKAAKTSRKWLRARQRKHLEWIQGAIKILEGNIINAAKSLETNSSGNLETTALNFTKSQHLHQRITNLFKKDYDDTARSIVNDFTAANSQVKRNFAQVGEIVNFTDIDRTMLDGLRDGYYQDYVSTGRLSRDRITRAMYGHVIGGSSFASLVTDIRSALRGSNAKSATGRPLSQYSALYARDMIMNYHGDVMMMKADELEMEYFKYVGTIMSRSRKFCIQRVGRVFSKKEIESWNYRWKGRSGPALTHRGGYNCRHHWQPVRKEWLPDQQQQKINTLGRVPK